MTQESFDDIWISDGERLRDEGMAQALEAMDIQDWKTEATHWVNQLQPGECFTSENLTDAIGLPRGGIGINMNNAVGAVIRAFSAKSHRMTEATGTYVKARRPSNHSAVLMVWRKL